MSRMVRLDRDTMSGYLLNVLGTDQIHDFCGSRLEGAKQKILKTFAISASTRNNLNNNRKGQKKRRQTGGFPILIDLPTDSEFIEQQCLEIINIFVNTIIEDNTTNDSVNNMGNILSDATSITGGRNSPPSTMSSDTEPENIHTSSPHIGKSPQSYSYLVKPMEIGKVTEHTINSNPVSDDSEWEPVYDKINNVMEWGKHVKSKIESFINTVPNNINESLNYICIDDVTNIFTSYLNQLSNIRTSTDVINFEYFITLYVESMNYFISPMLISCSNNTSTQRGGNAQNKPLTSVMSTMIKQMAFTFCNIPDNYMCDDWKTTPNWKCFEFGLLNNNISSVEKHSSDWIREHIIPDKPKEVESTEQPNKKQKLDDIVPDIKPLEGIFDVSGKLNCNLNPKTQKRHIINNSANLNESWKPYILNNYPSFIDSQPSGGVPLLEKMDKYDCGFQDPSGNESYNIIMNTLSNKHTISIQSNNNKFTFNKTFSNFKIYDKETTQTEYATRWKDVTLCVALINAFENVSSILKNNKIIKLEDLINSIIKKLSQKIKNKTGEEKDQSITELFYSFSLFKGLGDISQEMTAVIKYGGGNNNTINNTGNNYETFDASGNALRLFLAGDILSANRFILTLKYGLQYGLKNKIDNNINSKAYGGYLHVYGCKPTDMYLIDQYQKPTKWGGNKKHSRKYKNSKRKRKNHTKNTRNKHYKTYKLYKKNT